MCDNFVTIKIPLQCLSMYPTFFYDIRTITNDKREYKIYNIEKHASEKEVEHEELAIKEYEGR